nr:reverse transcriptase domain-containing protein [Tanacetum cinerariifolium]
MVTNQIRPPGFPPVQTYQNNQNNFNQGQLHRPQVNQPPAYQAPAYQAPIPQTQSLSQTDFESYIKANDAVLRNMQNQGQNVQNRLANLTDMLSNIMNSNIASSSGSGTLSSNTVTNPKEDLKGITTRSGVAYQGPTIPTPSKVVKQGIEVTKDQVQTLSSQSIAPVQPPAVQSETQTLIFETVVAPVSASMPNLKPLIPYPLRCDNERHHDQANEHIEKFYDIFKDMSFEISFMDALILMPKFASTLKALIGNKEKLSEMARTLMNDHCSAVILNKLPKKLGDPGKFLIPYHLVSKPIGITKDVSVKVGVFHFLADFMAVDFKPDPRVPLILGRCFLKTDRALIDVHKEGDILLLEAILNSKPLPPLPNHEQSMPSFKKELKACEAKTIKSSNDEPPEDTPFIFSEDCIKAFQMLKKKLTEAPILIAPNWDLPFELMCDASDFAIGAVLGQRHEKHFRPIHYASKTITEAESNYTTTEKEMLAVV